MELHRITLTKEQLNSIPEEERTLIVLLGHAANELSVLGKLLHFSMPEQGDAEIFAEARNAQVLTLVRILGGKIYECWQLLGKGFFATRLSQLYEPKFDEVSRDALAALKRYFGRKNVIEVVRNKFGFHYSTDQIPPGYAKVDELDVLNVYLSRKSVNSLYVFSETISGRAMLEAIDPNDHGAAMDQLLGDVLKANSWLSDVISACMLTCLENNVGGNLYSLGASIINVQGAPDAQKVAIPYFIDFEDDSVGDGGKVSGLFSERVEG